MTKRHDSPFASDFDTNSRVILRARDREFSLAMTSRFRQHYVEERFEPLTSDLLANLLHGRELFVDVGAHYGFFTLLAATAHPQVKVIALEPVEENHALLTEGIRYNGVAERVEAMRVAASDRSGTAPLFISEACDNCSFYRHPATDTIGTAVVATVTLDDLLRSRAGRGRAVVKIDTDGHELPVLAGLGDTLKEAEDVRLIVELNPKMQLLAGHPPEDLIAELQALGFTVFVVDDWERRYLGVRRPSDWRSVCEQRPYVNLYCVPRERALSVAMFSHSIGLQGAERSLLSFVRLFVQDQGAVCTVVLPGPGPLQERLERLGAATFSTDIPWWCDFDELSRETMKSRAERGLAALRKDVLPRLQLVAPDVVESITLTFPWGAIAAALLDVPHVWHVCEYGDQLTFAAPFEEILESIREASNLILTRSSGLSRALFPGLEEDRCRSVGVWIEPPSRSFAERRRLESARVRLVVAGSIIPGKDQATAVRALADLVGRGHDVELVLAGHSSRPDYQRLLEELARELEVGERVYFVGFVDEPYEVLAGGDVALVCSEREGFARTAVEAVLVGRPVVLTEGCGCAEILRDGREALWFEAGDPRGLADAVERVLREPGLVEKLVVNASRAIDEGLSRQQVSRLRRELFLRLRGQPNALRERPLLGVALEAALSVRAGSRTPDHDGMASSC